MENKSLKEFFSPAQEVDEEFLEDVEILLHFHQGQKVYATPIEQVKEIVEFPHYIPFPKKNKYMGVFNLRGTIIPILYPFGSEIPQSRGRQRLIVFEIDKGEFVALPASAIMKKEVEKDELVKGLNFVTIDAIPYELFDINSHLKESA